MRLIIILSFLFSLNLQSQSLSDKEFEKRLDFEKGNYPIQNYNQDFLDRPGYVWGIVKSKNDNLIYMAANEGVIEYDGVNIRRVLVKKGETFSSENDTEVAAGYISNQISSGQNLESTLKESLKNLDGFYTFIAGTKKGLALLRDEIACKPAVVAETDDYVAIASEFQAMAHLPGVNDANIFEPEPGIVYSWGN